MSNVIDQKKLISHLILPETLEHTIQKMNERIKQQGDKSYITVMRQLELLKQLSEFDFGCYLLQNQGINGYWTHYILTHPWYGRQTGKNNRGEPLTALENFLLNRAPTILATQQRFKIFLEENQTRVTENAALLCIPCGMMGELFYLDYKNIKDIHLAGIDYDADALNDAKILGEQKYLSKFIKLFQQDAWNLDVQKEFDLISSNGLNIYESDDEKITELYRRFYNALKAGGKLVTSFLTNQSEWDMFKINQEDLLLQKIIFADIIEAKWQCYRSSEQTYAQLKSVGFEDVSFIYDDAKLFPTVVAYKK